MRIKSKPKKPVRVKNRQYKEEVNEGDSLKDVINFISEKGIDPADVSIDKECAYWDDYDTIYIYWKADESDTEFEIRMKAYETKLSNYNEWRAANKAEIEEELEKRKNEEAAKQQGEIAALERKLKKLKEGE